ncbi:MAG: DUF6516 family protein [Burkholderiaceae bacterium]|nr:DUF6516 family protein [Burkholderiaceae bacterium]MCD8564774.1 DUF6516 family protein [Burkholderiaceae bacterium]
MTCRGVQDGARLVGYDNERVKGDHKHIVNVEMPYGFTTVEQLMADFMAGVEGVNHAKGK